MLNYNISNVKANFISSATYVSKNKYLYIKLFVQPLLNYTFHSQLLDPKLEKSSKNSNMTDTDCTWS